MFCTHCYIKSVSNIVKNGVDIYYYFRHNIVFVTFCIKFLISLTITSMIVVTAMLLFVTLIFAPIRFRVNVFAYLQRLAACFAVNIGALRVFNEHVALNGKYVCCDGTIATDIDLTSIDRKNGIDLLKCITVDKFCVSLQNNILNVSMYYVALENAFAALITATLCNLFHCSFYSQVVGTLDESKVQVQVVASTSVAELSFCLLKQGVRRWKTHKSEK